MAVITEQPVSTLASMLPTKLLIAFLVVAGTTMIIYSMLPLGLADTLITLITEAEETYIEAHRMGILSAADTEMLAILQLEVSTVTESTLRNSLSWRAALRDFLHGRTFTLLWWIREVKQFETHIKILKESQLRTEINLNPRAVFLRRRGMGPRYSLPVAPRSYGSTSSRATTASLILAYPCLNSRIGWSLYVPVNLKLAERRSTAKGKGKAAASSAEQDDGVDLDTQQNVDGKDGVVHDSEETQNEHASAEAILVDFIGMESPPSLPSLARRRRVRRGQRL
ncbi:hypothetical protein DFH08DRAFT_941004, partial [Mycena albidolilacea]